MAKRLPDSAQNCIMGIPPRLVVYAGQHHSSSRHSFNKDALARYLEWCRICLLHES